MYHRIYIGDIRDGHQYSDAKLREMEQANSTSSAQAVSEEGGAEESQPAPLLRQAVVGEVNMQAVEPSADPNAGDVKVHETSTELS